jgi:hypothetical protein
MLTAMIATVVVLLVAIAGALATISGSIQAIDWAIATAGWLPVALVGAFAAGVVLTHAAHRASRARRS